MIGLLLNNREISAFSGNPHVSRSRKKQYLGKNQKGQPLQNSSLRAEWPQNTEFLLGWDENGGCRMNVMREGIAWEEMEEKQRKNKQK